MQQDSSYRASTGWGQVIEPLVRIERIDPHDGRRILRAWKHLEYIFINPSLMIHAVFNCLATLLDTELVLSRCNHPRNHK